MFTNLASLENINVPLIIEHSVCIVNNTYYTILYIIRMELEESIF